MAAIKRELVAVLIVGLAGIPLVSLWLDGLRELLVLAGYGVGAALWIRVRAYGLLLASRGLERSPGQESDGS